MKRFIRDIKKYSGYAVYSAKAALRAEVANSYLNWIWWILEPLLFMFVYMFIGIVVYRKGENNFGMFVFVGLTVWNFFSKNVLSSVKLVNGAKSVISKIYLPKYVLVLSKMINNAIKMLISFGIIIAMMIFYRLPPTWGLFQLIPILVTLVLFTFGCCTMVMHFGVFFDDLYNIVNVGLRLVFYLSGVFYSINDKLGGQVWGLNFGRLMNICNPVALCINSVRNVLMNTGAVEYQYLAFWFTIGAILSVLGVSLIYRYENSYVKVI